MREMDDPETRPTIAADGRLSPRRHRDQAGRSGPDTIGRGLHEAGERAVAQDRLLDARGIVRGGGGRGRMEARSGSVRRDGHILGIR